MSKDARRDKKSLVLKNEEREMKRRGRLDHVGGPPALFLAWAITVFHSPTERHRYSARLFIDFYSLLRRRRRRVGDNLFLSLSLTVYRYR